MGSKKRSAQAKELAAFKAQLGGGMDELFERESKRVKDDERNASEAMREKACASKNRYATRSEAEDAIASCEEHGRTGLRCYKCSYCGGWHLTSKRE